MSETPQRQEGELKWAFVEMLFALAVSQVAMSAADLVMAQGSFSEKCPAFGHLVVGLVLIATSWVGWRHSKSLSIQPDIANLFSLPFLRLLIDVLLVILYFIIVRTAEIEQVNGQSRFAAPTAEPESRWLCVVFLVYAVWDLVVDLFPSGSVPPVRSRFLWTWKWCCVLFVSTFASLFCLWVGVVVYSVAEHRTSWEEVLLLDVSLICIVFLFRIVKLLENILSSWLGIQDCKAFLTKRVIVKSEVWFGCALFLVFVLSLLGAWGVPFF